MAEPTAIGPKLLTDQQVDKANADLGQIVFDPNKRHTVTCPTNTTNRYADLASWPKNDTYAKPANTESRIIISVPSGQAGVAKIETAPVIEACDEKGVLGIYQVQLRFSETLDRAAVEAFIGEYCPASPPAAKK